MQIQLPNDDCDLIIPLQKYNGTCSARIEEVEENFFNVLKSRLFNDKKNR